MSLDIRSGLLYIIFMPAGRVNTTQAIILLQPNPAEDYAPVTEDYREQNQIIAVWRQGAGEKFRTG